MLKKYGITLFWAICVVLAALRFLWLGDAPLRYDESHNMIRAVDCAERLLSDPVGVLTGSPSKLFHALAVALFGITEFATRFPVVVQSLIISLFVFLVGNRFFGRKIGRWALLISLLLPFNFSYGRYAQYDIGQTFYFVIGLYFLFSWIYEERIVGRWLAPLFLALAFLSKYNALILQSIILFSYMLCGLKESRRYRVGIENLVFTGVFVLIFSSYNLPTFLVNLAGWVATVLGVSGGSSGGEGLSLFAAFLTAANFHFVAFTLLWFVVLGYAVVYFRELNERERMLFFSVLLYSCAVAVQGRLQMRYLNLESPLFALLAGSVFVNATAQNLPRWFCLVLCAGAVQCGYEYYNYYLYEKTTMPYRVVYSELEALDATAPSIYLPKNFPLNYAGIYQLDLMVARDGARDAAKSSVYHFAHKPFPYADTVQEDCPSRVKMEGAIDKSIALLSRMDLEAVKKLWADFIAAEKSKQAPKLISLEQFLNAPHIPRGSFYLKIIQSPRMYPLLEKHVELSKHVGIPHQENIWRVFFASGTEYPCMVLYKKDGMLE
jgi:hypothetical protein